MTDKPVIEIDGDRFDDLEGFYREIVRYVIQGNAMGRNLNALNDILNGGFGTPEGGFILRWVNSDRSRIKLGFDETIRLWEPGLRSRHKNRRNATKKKLEELRRGQGATLFDDIVEVIHDHGPGGDQAEDGVELELA